jgi:hypothetical protein
MRTVTVTLEFTLTADDSETRIKEAFMRKLASDGYCNNAGYKHYRPALTTTETLKSVRVVGVEEVESDPFETKRAIEQPIAWKVQEARQRELGLQDGTEAHAPLCPSRVGGECSDECGVFNRAQARAEQISTALFPEQCRNEKCRGECGTHPDPYQP